MVVVLVVVVVVVLVLVLAAVGPRLLRQMSAKKQAPNLKLDLISMSQTNNRGITYN